LDLARKEHPEWEVEELQSIDGDINIFPCRTELHKPFDDLSWYIDPEVLFLGSFFVIDFDLFSL
jgi:hypothetical protein